MKEQRSKRVEAPRESPLRKAASLCGRGCGRAGARLWGARGTAAASCLPDEALCLLASANSTLSVGPQRGRLSYWTHGRVSRPRPARGRSRRCRARGCRRGTQPECAELAHRRRGREGGSLSPGLGCVSLAGDLPPFWMHCPLRWGGAAVAPVALGGIRARPALPPKQVWLQRSTLLTKPATPLWRRVGGGGTAGQGTDDWSGSTLLRREPQPQALGDSTREAGHSSPEGGAVEGTGTGLGRRTPGLSPAGYPGQGSPRKPPHPTPNHQMLTSLPFQILGSRRRLSGQWQKGDGDPWVSLAGAGSD